MADIDRFQQILEELVAEIPEQLFCELNGGVMLLPETKIHTQGQGNNLYTMGEYCVQIPGLGRYIVIYYGSFIHVHGSSITDRMLREEIRKTLAHELRHHMESLSGVRDLEIIDQQRLNEYYKQNINNEN